MTTPDHSAIPPVSIQVSETEAMNQRIRERGECVWTVFMAPDENEVWSTECGQDHVFAVGGPEENDHKWCAYCGKMLIVK